MRTESPSHHPPAERRGGSLSGPVVNTPDIPWIPEELRVAALFSRQLGSQENATPCLREPGHLQGTQLGPGLCSLLPVRGGAPDS